MRLLDIFILFICTSGAFGAPSRQKRNVEIIQEIAKYFEEYTELEDAQEGIARIGFSSETGQPVEQPIEERPDFIERVIEMQESVGQEPTGEVTQKLLDEARQPRCGISEHPQDSDELAAYTVKATWDSKYIPQSQIYSLTFSITEEQDIPDGLDFNQAEEGLLSAMCLWESNSNIRFRNIGKENMLADITVSFAQGDHGDWYSFDGKGGTLAHAFYPENGRLHFDKSETWYLAKKGSVDYYKKDIFTVAAHELGHNIGLMHSKKRGALMAPIYKYSGTVEEYKLPEDDVLGVASMYGERIGSNPAKEPGTACNELRKKYGIAADKLTTSKNTQQIRKPIKAQCNDDPRYQKYCSNWKKAGYCEEPKHERTLRRRCKNTCGFCPVKPMKQKPKRRQEASQLSSSICGIEKFDSVAVVLDTRNVLNTLYFKDDYYFESSQLLEANVTSPHSFLNSNDDIGDIIQWKTDPKTIKVGNYKIQRREMFARSERVDAVLLAKTWYLAFEKDGGVVHQYSLGTPTISYMGNFTVESTFHGYPHATIDAGFVEIDVGPKKETLYTLFRKNRMWQFKEVKISDSGRLDQQRLEFEPVETKQDVPIEQWHGVAACDIDAVFQYKGIPYFLKGNTFWPAVDTEALVPRDITYNFLRCWEEEPVVDPTPPSCDATFDSQTGDGDGNGGAQNRFSVLVAIFCVITYLGVKG